MMGVLVGCWWDEGMLAGLERCRMGWKDGGWFVRVLGSLVGCWVS